MPELNFPKFNIKNRLVNNSIQVFDEVRKGYFKLTPEEWVRQHVINYLVHHKNYPIGLMQVEKLVRYNNLNTRADLIVNNRDLEPVILVECKAPNVKVGKDVFDQIAKYNFSLKAKYLYVTNGLAHFCCTVNYKSGKMKFLKDIPEKNN